MRTELGEGYRTCNRESQAGGLATDMRYSQLRKATTIDTAIPIGLKGKRPFGLLHIRDGGITQQFSSHTRSIRTLAHTRTSIERVKENRRGRRPSVRPSVRPSFDPTCVIDFILDLDLDLRSRSFPSRSSASLLTVDFPSFSRLP
jgi:hypothetical protein